jgi:hypothetical protein
MEDRPSTPSGSPSARRLLPLGVALAILGYHVAPLWREITSWARGFDVRYYWFVIEVDRTTISEYGQFPLWNPYYCGGAPQLANPQTGTLSPLTLLILMFGTPLGFRLGYTVGLVAALFALRAYARTLGLDDLGSTVAGAGYAVCGAFAHHLGGGHWGWLGFALYPCILRSLHLALEGRREHLVWGAAALLVIIFHWPIYPMAYAFVTVGAYAVSLGLARTAGGGRRLGRAVGTAGAMLVLALALGAVRLLPIAAHVSGHPRKVTDWDFTRPWDLLETYAVRHAERAFPGHQYVFPEYANYFGFVGVALILAGAVIVLRHRRALGPVLASAVLFVLFQLGHIPALPWWLLHKLPVYENLRVPSRFTIVAGLFMCVLIGVAVDRWTAGWTARDGALSARQRWAGALTVVLALAYLVDASSWNRLRWAETIGTAPPADKRAAQFHQAAGDRWMMMTYPRANRGSLACFEETPLDISPRLRANLPADEYLADPSAGQVRRLSWSPNRIVLDVDTKRPATLLVNQNYDPGWRAEGGEIASDGGLLAARVPAGRRTVTFRYLPRSFVIGAAVSLAMAVAAALFVIMTRASARARARRTSATSARTGAS